MHGVSLFNYCALRWNIFNAISSDRNEDRMKKLFPNEVNIPTYQFGVHKIVGILYSRVMFRVHHIWRHGKIYFHYYVPQQDHSKCIWSDLNKDYIQKLHPQEIDVSTYHFGVHKTILTSSSKVIFRVYPRKRDSVGLFEYSIPW